jgi:hypothetical protein
MQTRAEVESDIVTERYLYLNGRVEVLSDADCLRHADRFGNEQIDEARVPASSGAPITTTVDALRALQADRVDRTLLVETTGLSQEEIERHLGILRQEGFVQDRDGAPCLTSQWHTFLQGGR